MTEVTVWFPDDVLERLQGLAERQRRTVPAQVLRTVELALDAAERTIIRHSAPSANERRHALEAFAAALREVHIVGGAPTTRALARKVGYSHTTVHSYLVGKQAPPWDKVEAIILALGGDPDQLRGLWVAMHLSAGTAR